MSIVLRFLLDERADFRLAAWLRALGHDVTAIAIDYPASLDDREALRIAHREGRVRINNDTDFGDLVGREELPHAGVVLFCLRSNRLAVKLARLEAVLTDHAEQLGRFLVVTEHDVRAHQP